MEVSYEKYLKGLDGSILTMTTAYGTEVKMEPKTALSRWQAGH
ncbi:MAG: hypothetical protein ACLSD6_03235 [Clostridium sp.]